MLFASFHLENLTMTLFGLLLGNQWQSSMLEEFISTSNFLHNLGTVSSISEFSIDSGSYLVLIITVWSTDIYSSTAVLMKQYTPSVLSWPVWRHKFLTVFSHDFAWGQMLLYLYLPRWNQTCSGIPQPKNYFGLR